MTDCGLCRAGWIIDCNTAGAAPLRGASMFAYDPRDRENDDPRDVEAHWITLGRGSSEDHQLDAAEDTRERAEEQRGHDPRDPFVLTLELPSGPERELVVDDDHRYELNGDDSRSLATIGAFRVM